MSTDYFSRRKIIEIVIIAAIIDSFQLVKCYYCLEDYDNLENLVDSLQPDDKLLVSIGHMFATVGMGQQAVEAYTKVIVLHFKSVLMTSYASMRKIKVVFDLTFLFLRLSQFV